LSGVEDRRVVVHVDRTDVFRLRVITESYEGLMIITTLDEASTRVQVAYLSCHEQDILALLQSLVQEGWLEIESGPEPLC